MKKNVASQSVGAEMITASDGTPFTGTVTVLITIDNGTQSASGGTAPAHEGNGYHSYTPTQAETNGNHIAFTFTGSGAIPATVQVYTGFPQTVDNATGIAAIPTAPLLAADINLTAGVLDEVAVLSGHTAQTADHTTAIADVPTVAEFNARTLVAASYFDPAADAVANVTLVATTTTVTNDVGIDAGSVDDIWDEVLTGATHNVSSSSGRRLRALQDFGLYQDGLVWIDTVGGAAGTIDFENGTVTNPVSNLADALTIKASLNLLGFHLASGSSITLTSSAAGFQFNGNNWTLAFGGQSVDGANICTASVSGIYVGTPTLDDCLIGAITGDSLVAEDCSLEGNILSNGAGDWFLHKCFSGIAGTGTTMFDFGAAVLNTNFNMRAYSGGIELKNCGAAGIDNASIEGHGQIILNADCVGGTVAIRGHFEITDNAGGAVTLADRVNFESILDDGTTTYDRATDSLQEIRDHGTTIKSETALIVADTNELQSDNIPGLIAALENISTADVNAQILDVLNVDTFAELASIPAAATTLTNMIRLIYTMTRNKTTQTATTLLLRNDADAATIGTSTLSDDGTTFIKGELL